ncbi:MAG: UDP-N-acetylmuramate dehydrogenase [Armatimonadetes bacterium]|nr:UDP-N-acetylmuramate dehydrogenase [Armatimonadota bacterium]
MATRANLREDVPLAPFTTLGIGGPARFYLLAEDEAAVRRAVSWAADQGHRWMVLGGGSNLLVSDEGFPGLVIHLATRGLAFEDGTARAAAGEEWDGLVAACVARGLAGIECLSGIPGRVGATPIQNVGAYGQEVREVIREVRCFDTVTGSDVSFDAEECRFAYRDSRFKSEDAGRYVVLEVTYALRPGGAPTVRYADLQNALCSRTPSLQTVRDTVIAVRRRKSMVLDPQDSNSRSVGSFFTNPIVSEAVDGAPGHPTADGRVKLSAAWLIEQTGFPKGYRDGAVGLSDNHTLAIVNRGGATAADVKRLMRAIQEGVQARFGVWLVAEPVFV